jgi:hypothetical protein
MCSRCLGPPAWDRFLRQDRLWFARVPLPSVSVRPVPSAADTTKRHREAQDVQRQVPPPHSCCPFPSRPFYVTLSQTYLS